MTQVQRVEVLDGGRPEQEARADQVADAVHALRVDPAVRDDSHEPGHEERADAHRRVDAADLAAREAERDDHVGAERDQPRAPHEELHEVHHREAELDAHGAASLVCAGGFGAKCTTLRMVAKTYRPYVPEQDLLLTAEPAGLVAAGPSRVLCE